VRRLVICALVAALAAIIGPRIVGPTSRAAGTPFVYEPPEGYVLARDVKGAEAEGATVWIDEAAEERRFDGSIADRKALSTRIILNHSNKEMSVEEAALAKLVAEMPQAFEGMCTWVHRRHELRVRADGARVGLIEGDCDRDVDLSAFGLPAQPVKMRKLQLMFPDDAGTSIVTASYPTEQASRWAPLLEASIGKAKGVATRAPAPPVWTHAAWAAAGAVLGWLGTALVYRTDGEPPTKDARKKGAGKTRAAQRGRATDEEEEEEDA